MALASTVAYLFTSAPVLLPAPDGIPRLPPTTGWIGNILLRGGQADRKDKSQALLKGGLTVQDALRRERRHSSKPKTMRALSGLDLGTATAVHSARFSGAAGSGSMGRMGRPEKGKDITGVTPRSQPTQPMDQ